MQHAARATTSTTARGKVTVQSFEIANLKPLNRQLPGVPLVQLLDAKTLKPGDVLAAGGTHDLRPRWPRRPGLRDIAALRRRRQPVEGLHRAARREPAPRCRRPRSSTTRTRAGLDVVAYTFRNENQFLPSGAALGAPTRTHYGNAIAEYQQFFELGVDGVFSDNPDTAKAARDDE